MNASLSLIFVSFALLTAMLSSLPEVMPKPTVSLFVFFPKLVAMLVLHWLKTLFCATALACEMDTWLTEMASMFDGTVTDD